MILGRGGGEANGLISTRRGSILKASRSLNLNVETVRRKSGLMRALSTPAAVLLLGGVTTDAVRVTHDVNFDASLFRSTVVARPRIDLSPSTASSATTCAAATLR